MRVGRALGVLAALFVTALPALAGTASAGSPVPFTDPNASGYIGLCNEQGQSVMSGSIYTTPFVWKSISSVPALKEYQGTGETATLFAYQPVKGYAPGDWSGEQMTAASEYQTTTRPTVQATGEDESLYTFIHDFPPLWDNLIQLRIVVAKPGFPADTTSYPAAVLQVSGTTWRVLQGGTLPCSSGQGVNVAVIDGLTTSATPTAQPTGPPPSIKPVIKHVTVSPSPSASPTVSPASRSSTGAPSASASVSRSPVAAAGHSSSTGSSSTGRNVAVAVVAVVFIALGSLALFRRRRAGA